MATRNQSAIAPSPMLKRIPTEYQQLIVKRNRMLLCSGALFLVLLSVLFVGR